MLTAHGASFVTLTQAGQLRGCIGSLQAHRPLHEDVLANAQAAALQDPRFAPVTAQEAPTLEVEVSVLTAPEPLSFANESHALWQLQPHEHGVIFSCEHEGRAYRSTFLPQVWAQLPDPRKFMAQLKRKAGLPSDHWSDAVRLSVYRVQKFTEADHAA
jgi:AmmeMemoRadiSam system protein A